MAFDLGASLGRLKPEKRTKALSRRPDVELPFLDKSVSAGVPLLLDASVYIDVLQGRAPDAVRDLLRIRQINHSSVALAELTRLFGRLDPAHLGTGAVLSMIAETIDDMPAHRLTAPSIAALAEAGMITGIIARLRGLPKAGKQPLINDAALFLQALESGATLLSRNISDMDFPADRAGRTDAALPSDALTAGPGRDLRVIAPFRKIEANLLKSRRLSTQSTNPLRGRVAWGGVA